MSIIKKFSGSNRLEDEFPCYCISREWLINIFTERYNDESPIMTEDEDGQILPPKLYRAIYDLTDQEMQEIADSAFNYCYESIVEELEYSNSSPFDKIRQVFNKIIEKEENDDDY